MDVSIWTSEDSLGGTVVVSDGSDVPVCRIPAYRDDKKRVGMQIAAVPEMIEVLKSLEWAVEATPYFHCPACDAEKSRGHRSGCRLESAISKVKGRTD